MSSTSTAVVSSAAKDLARDASKFATRIESLVTAPKRTISATTKSNTMIPIPSSSPGSFRHPRFTEIISRQSQSSLTDAKLKKAAINVGALILTVILSRTLHTCVMTILTIAYLPDAANRSTQIITILRLYFLTNTIFALRPVIPYLSAKDEIADIPLTPSQRALLGLDPSMPSSASSSASGGSPGTYITPPRYRRYSNSNSPLQSTANTNLATDRRSVSATYHSSSPLSSGTTSRLDFSGSPFTANSPYYNTSIRPSSSNPNAATNSGNAFSFSTSNIHANNSPTASPLFHKAIAQQKQQYNTAMANVSQELDFSASTANVFSSPSANNNRNTFLNSSLSRSRSLRERENHNNKEEVDRGMTPPRPTQARDPGINYKWLYERSTSSRPGSGSVSRRESLGF